MERVKSDLEKEIAAIFKKHTQKGRECDVAGIINGVMGSYFQQLETGNWSEKHPTVGYFQKKENQDAAKNAISGFLWAMEAAGMIDSEKRDKMQTQLSAIRFPDYEKLVNKNLGVHEKLEKFQEEIKRQDADRDVELHEHRQEER